MTIRTYHIEFLTPCFCAGADQTRAELRPAAIRGQLRWWFRCLGGSADEERTIFGGVQGDNPASSTFNIRIRQQPTGGQGDWHNKIPQQGVEPRAYLLGFFCGRTDRLNPKGALSPGSQALIEIIFKRPPFPLLEQALKFFFSVGALGFRASRTAGAVTSAEHALSEEGWNSLASELRAEGFQVALGSNSFGDWVSLIRSAGDLLKNKLRGREGLGISAGRNGSNPNALGSAEPRQASVLHLRPVRIDNRLRLALIEAPHFRILGQPASRAHANRGSIIMLARERHLIQP
jgi:hypothetical protein